MALPDAIDALERFLDRIEPFDPEPQRPVGTVELKVGRGLGTFELTEHAVKALHDALFNYVDPDDAGTCDNCGSQRVDRNMRCHDCDYVSGLFGLTLALHAAEVQARGD